MAKQKKQSLLNGALILSAAIVAVKFIGVFFKLYVTLKIGYDGKAYYAAAYNIYTPIYSIALAGLPTAVSKMVASKAAEGKYRDVKKLFSVSRTLFALLGIVGTVIIVLITYPYAKSNAFFDAVPAILCIAPSLFFCCVMSGYRGYYQGLRNMTPSAVSQVFEAAGKLIFGWILINLVMLAPAGFADKIPFFSRFINNGTQAYAAAAAIAGVTIGSFMGLVYLMIKYRRDKDSIPSELLKNSPHSESKKALAKALIALAIPIAVSSLVFNVTTLIDNWIIPNRLQHVLENSYDTVAKMYPGIVSARGFDSSSAAVFKDYLYGAYDTVLEIKNIVPTFTITLGLSAIPVISEAWTKKEFGKMQDAVNSVIRITLLIALPAGAGMFALARPILTLLYGSSEVNAPAIPYIAPILMLYGISVIFLALAQPVTSMLQASDRTDVPIKAMAIGAVLKIAANYVLVSIPSVNIQGAVAGSILCNIVMVGYGMIVLAKQTGLRYDFKGIFFKPLFCSAVSAFAAYIVNCAYNAYLPDEGLSFAVGILTRANISTIAAVFAAVCVYAIMLFATSTLSESDVNMLPGGRKIAKVLAKYGLLSYN